MVLLLGMAEIRGGDLQSPSIVTQAEFGWAGGRVEGGAEPEKFKNCRR